MLNLSSENSSSHSKRLSALCSVKPLVPLLSLLENYGSHDGAHDDSQQSTQQEQEDFPPSEGRAPEVSSRIVNVVCGGKTRFTIGLYVHFNLLLL